MRYLQSPHKTVFVALVLVATVLTASPAHAVSRDKIDRRVEEALSKLRELVDNADSILDKAAGVLVMPSIKKGGFGIGGEGGSGALMIDGETVAYYRTAGASIGFQMGFQVRRQVMAFMEEEALEDFRGSRNWEVGVDGSVAVVTLDAGGRVNTENFNQPVLAFVFGSKGLMYNLTLEGSKFWQIEPD